MVVLAFTVAIVTALALVGVALVFRDNGSDTTSTGAAAGVDLTGISQNGAVLGKPSAHVTLIEYADAQCPGCRYYALELFPSITKQYIRTGKIKTEYHGFPFIGPDSVKALRFILAAGEQDRLWQLQQELYRYQGGENKGWVTDDLVRERASDIPGLDVDKLFADAKSKRITREAEAAYGKGQAIGLPGTPTFFLKIGDQKPYYIQTALALADMRAAIDDALAG